jgi:L-rhamnose isomerase
MEAEGDLTSRLAMMEELRTLPFGAVWDYYCLKSDVPVAEGWLNDVRAYEKDVLSKR